MAKQLLIGLQEEIWMEVRSPLGVAWHGSRHFRHPTSRDQQRVHWASASARGQAILDFLGNLVSVDEEDQPRQSAVESWGRKYVACQEH